MPRIVIVDTSVLLNVRDVPGFNQDRNAVLDRFGDLVDAGANLLLPMGAVFETGNHIAQLPDGNHRRNQAETFRDRVREALEGRAPWAGALGAASIAERATTDGLAGQLPGLGDAGRQYGRLIDRQGLGAHLRATSRSPGQHLVARPTPDRL